MADPWDLTAHSKLCLVTTGATAPFAALIESVLSPSTLDMLRDSGFTHLSIQYGSAKDVYERSLGTARAHVQSTEQHGSLLIGGFPFDRDNLRPQFHLVSQSKGLVISHAGSGTILAALRYQIPLIVVPNTALLDNHQEELAAVMERNNYLVRGDVADLVPAIKKSEEFRVKMTQFPPITSGKHRETKSFAAIMDDTVGFLD